MTPTCYAVDQRMSMIRAITRISPVSEIPGSLSKLLKPAEFGNPIEVQRCNIIDPRNGTEFLMETFFCLGKVDFSSGDTKEELASECKKVPGLIAAAAAEDVVEHDALSKEHFEFLVPKSIAKERVKEMLSAVKGEKSNGATSGEKPNTGIKIHIDLKKLRESSKPLKQNRITAKKVPKKFLKKIPKKETLLKPLLKYFVEKECLICGRIIANASKHKIRRHMFTHIRMNCYFCDCCSKQFSSASTLYSHKLKKEEVKEYRCNLCEEKFRRKYLLTVHYQDAHPQVVPPNPDEKGLLTKQKIPTCFSCSICSKKFPGWKSIANHRSSHSGEESYSCLFCGKSFSNSFLLRYHSHLRVITQCHTCQVCDKTFSSFLKLLKHKKTTHMKHSRHLCQICGKKFNFQSSLKKHILRLHSKA